MSNELTQDQQEMLDEIQGHAHRLESQCDYLDVQSETDSRWIAIGRTHLQQGLMALRRAVERPDTF